MIAVIDMERDTGHKTLCIVIISFLYICLSRGHNYKMLANYTRAVDILLCIFFLLFFFSLLKFYNKQHHFYDQKHVKLFTHLKFIVRAYQWYGGSNLPNDVR